MEQHGKLMNPPPLPANQEYGCAFVLINGIQLLQCRLPAPSERFCEVSMEASPSLIVMDDFGRVELSCLYYPSLTVDDRSGFRWVAHLRADDAIIELGQLPRIKDSSRIVCRFVGSVPALLTLTVRYVDSAADVIGHPEEHILCTEIVEFVKSNFFRFTSDGFVDLSHIQNKLQSLEVYKRVVGTKKDSGHYDKNVLRFILAHPDVFRVRSGPAGQQYVALTTAACHDTPPSVFAERATNEARDEQEALDFMCGLLEGGDRGASEVLSDLSNQSEHFRNLLRASHTNLATFFRNHPEFWIATDPVHTTRVGLKRTVATLDVDGVVGGRAPNHHHSPDSSGSSAAA